MNRYFLLEVLYAEEGNGEGLPDGATPAGPLG